VSHSVHKFARLPCWPESESQIYFTTGGLPPISSSWRQAPWDPRLVTLFFQLNICGYSLYVTSLWREDGSVVYHCCWASPAQSFSGPSPAGLMTILYCLRFETPQTWRARFPYLYIPGTGWSGYNPSVMGSLFVPSYDSQSYRGGIRPRLHEGLSYWCY
jgi:hypothetical protein